MCLTEQRSLKLQGLVNGNERYILEGIIIVLIAAYIFYENVFMAVISFIIFLRFFVLIHLSVCEKISPSREYKLL